MTSMLFKWFQLTLLNAHHEKLQHSGQIVAIWSYSSCPQVPVVQSYKIDEKTNQHLSCKILLFVSRINTFFLLLPWWAKHWYTHGILYHSLPHEYLLQVFYSLISLKIIWGEMDDAILIDTQEKEVPLTAASFCDMCLRKKSDKKHEELHWYSSSLRQQVYGSLGGRYTIPFFYFSHFGKLVNMWLFT